MVRKLHELFSTIPPGLQLCFDIGMLTAQALRHRTSAVAVDYKLAVACGQHEL